MAFLVGYAKSAVCGAGAGAGLALTGGAAVYGGVTGDYRAAHGFANATRELGHEAAHGLEDAGRGIADTGRAALAMADSVNPGGNYNPFLSEPNLTEYEWVCAKVSQLVYVEYQKRDSSFADKEGYTWKEVQPGACAAKYDTKYLTVYQNGTTIVIGIRGTDPSDPGDLASDACIAIACIPPARCDEADQFARSMRSSGRYNTIYLAGHSLGGTVASYVGLACGFKVHCFNPGAAPHDKIASALTHGMSNCDGTVVVHRIGTDLISAFVSSSRSVQVKTYRKKHRAYFELAHSISQFVV